MDDENNLNEEEKLEQENFLLHSKILLKGGASEQFSDIPPEIENEFLKHVLEFEDSEFKTCREALQLKRDDYPESKSLSDKEVELQLKKIYQLLSKNGTSVDLNDGIPARIVYDYLVNDILFDDDYTIAVGMPGWHIDGCSGDCPSCWQMDYCNNKDDCWPEEELKREIEKRKAAEN